jgi:hypothetical protein
MSLERNIVFRGLCVGVDCPTGSYRQIGGKLEWLEGNNRIHDRFPGMVS